MRRVALVALVAVPLAGCGSSTSAHDQFVARASAICAKGQERGKQLGRPTGGASSLAFFAHAQALIAVMAKTLSRVTPPASQKGAYARFLASVKRESRYIGELGRYEREKDHARANAVLKHMEANMVNGEARALGLPKCAETVEPSG